MRALLILLCILLSGCSIVSGLRDKAALKAGYTSKARATQILEQTKAEYEMRLVANAKIIEDAQATFERNLGDKAQFAANSLYGADFAFALNPHPDRTHRVMDDKINEARAVLPPPTVEAMAAQNAEVKRQLDETLTSLDQLKADHEATLKDAATVRAKADKAEADLAAAKVARTELQTAKTNELAAKQTLLDAANDSVIAAEHKRGDDADARHKMMEKISLYLGIFAVACFAGAIYFPVYKVQTGLLGIVVGFAAIAIWYITPTIAMIVGAVFLVSIIVLIYWAIHQHGVATKTNVALINTNKDIEEKHPDIYASTVKPALTDWTTKYAKDASGTTIVVPDKAVTDHIDANLKASNRL